MKHTLIILTLLFLSGIMNLHAQNSLSSTEGFGKEVFKSFQSNDYALFQSLLITVEKYETILVKMGVPDSAKAAYREKAYGAIRHVRNQAQHNFDEIMSKAALNKINWKKAEVVTVQYFPREKSEGTERGDFIVIAQSGKVHFKLVISNCYKGEEWCIMKEIELYVVQE